jgi:hypothetical protein
MSPVFCGTNVVSICNGGNMAGLLAPLLDPRVLPVCDEEEDDVILERESV